LIYEIKGDAVYPSIVGPKVIAHICNDRCAWGAGFVLELSKRWQGPEKVYRSDKFSTQLGHVQYIRVEDDIVVANMIAQSGFGNAACRLNYLKVCLDKVAWYSKELGASIHMPRIGTGFGGRQWKEIRPIIESSMSDLEVYVYAA
jgi:O-acetyl-ADP-ribose deacetylase (regulator of RNase III)